MTTSPTISAHTAVVASLVVAIAIMLFGPSLEAHRTGPVNPREPSVRQRVSRLLRGIQVVALDRVVYGPVLALAALSLAVAVGLVAPLPDGRPAFDLDIARTALSRFDLAVLVVSYGVMSTSLDRSGFMRWCAFQAVLWGAGNARRGFFAVFAVCSAVTLVTSNDIVVVAMTPIFLHIGVIAGIRNLVPWLVAMFVAANTSAMGMLIGSPTNIVIATSTGMGFLSYSTLMFLPALAATVAAAVSVWVTGSMHRLPGGGISQRYSMSTLGEEIPQLSRTARSRAGIFIAVLTGMFTMDVIGISIDHVWSVAVLGAVVMVTLDLLPAHGRDAALHETVKRAPWGVPVFLLAFFTLVGALDHVGIVDALASWAVRWTPDHGFFSSLGYGYGAAMLANVVNDIPSALLWAEMIPALRAGLTGIDQQLVVGAILIGLNTGCYLTIIGALAGLMWRQIIRSSPIGPDLIKPTGWHLFVHGGIAAVVATPIACFVLWLQLTLTGPTP